MTTAPVMSITDEMLTELERKAKSATHGSWHQGTDLRQIEAGDGTIICHVAGSSFNGGVQDDAAYIASASPAAILTLIAALRKALSADPAAPVAQEPVAWRVSDPSEPEIGNWLSEEPGTSWHQSEPLYTAPPAAEQPDTVAVPRELLERAVFGHHPGHPDRIAAREKLRALLAGGAA